MSRPTRAAATAGPRAAPSAGATPSGPTRPEPAHPARARAALKPLAWISGGALALWLVTGVGFANYDTLYALVWGQQLSRGELPQYSLPIAPTPHPLIEGLGLIASPLGAAGAEGIVVALAFVALAALGYVVYRLGAEWFHPAVGLVAAAIVLTREPYLNYGVRAYADIPYLVLVLTALLVETRRRRAGAPVLALLAVAGLLRPEAWLFSGLYWLWLIPGERTRTELLRLAALAISAPLIWGLSDLLITGNPVWSLTKTQSTAQTLQRVRGLANVPVTGARRLGEVLRPPGLVGAGVGGVLALLWLRERARLGAIVGFAAVIGLAIIASPGLPINTRYVFLPAAILSIFCGVAVFGWLLLPRGDRRRPWWIAAAVGVVAVFVAFIPSQRDRISHTFENLRAQQRIHDDLVMLVANGAVNLRCGPVGVPNHRPIPLLALRLHTRPSNIADAQVTPITRGVYVDPASREVELLYTLDKHDPHPLVARVPAGFSFAGVNRSWFVYRRCV